MQPVSEAKSLFVWHELMTTDIPAAISFYTKVVGWEIEASTDVPGYQMWKVPGKTTVGGVFDLPEDAKKMGAIPNWMGNICVEDIDASVTKLQALGGQVYKAAFDIPNIGRVAIAADPTGASFALYQPSGSAPGHSGRGGVGEFSWCELSTSDPEAAWAFYSELLGWKKTDAMDMGPMGTYQMYSGPSGGTIGGMMRRPPEMPVSAWGFYVSVSNMDGAIETAIGRGAKLLHGPADVPGGDVIANLIDPQGAFFSLHARKE